MEIHLSAGQKKKREKPVQKPACHFLAPVGSTIFPVFRDVTDEYVNMSVLSSPLLFFSASLGDGPFFIRCSFT